MGTIFNVGKEMTDELKQAEARIEKLKAELSHKISEFCHEVEQHRLTRQRLAKLQQEK